MGPILLVLTSIYGLEEFPLIMVSTGQVDRDALLFVLISGVDCVSVVNPVRRLQFLTVPVLRRF